MSVFDLIVKHAHIVLVYCYPLASSAPLRARPIRVISFSLSIFWQRRKKKMVMGHHPGVFGFAHDENR